MFNSILKSLSSSEIEVTIIHSDIEHNSITVRPYCKRYKNAAETYVPININFTSLNSELNIPAQLIEICKPIVAHNILKESEVKADLISFIEENKHKTLTVDDKEIDELYFQNSGQPRPVVDNIDFIA
jgi:hypothetical protein